jgi:hypothetical protein
MNHKEDAINTAKEVKSILVNHGEANQVIVWQTKIHDIIAYDARIMDKTNFWELNDMSTSIHRGYESIAVFIA